MSNYYLALGIEKDADLKKIKKAYRICCKQYHPDVQTDEQKKRKFLIVQKAYETLSDEKKRKHYDEKLKEQKNKESVMYSHSSVVNERNKWKRNIKKYSSVLDDFFEGFVPGFFDNDFDHNKELLLELILSPQEARHGGDFPINIPVLELCHDCSGYGSIGPYICTSCSGIGQLKTHRSFILHLPSNVNHGAEARISLEGIGLKHVFLNIEVIIQQY